MGPRALTVVVASSLLAAAAGVPGPTNVAAEPVRGQDAESVSGSESDPDREPVLDAIPADQLENILDDPFAEIVEGEVVFTEPPILGPSVPGEIEQVVAESGEGGGSAQIPSIAEALTLHSRPTSTKTIYLDVDGHVTTGTPFNGTFDPLVTGSYSRESNGNENETFSDSELQGIVEIWERVAEDFASWDVDVTTEDPGVEALRKSTGSDEEYGIRVVITHDSEWYGPYGGVAYLYSFQYSTDRPAFVFSDNLARGKPKSVAEAASHEAGHSFGLSHDGKGSLSYYSGHGDWAPIMGVGYNRPVTQWSDGDYPDATNTQNDLAMIDAMVTRLDPDLGSGLGSSNSTTDHMITTSGTGGSTNEHAITISGGTATIDVQALPTAASNAANLVANVRLKNASGGVVASATPGSPTSWGLSTGAVGPGSYTLEVEPAGWAGNGGSDPGFDSYGSLGWYRVTIEVTTGGTTTTTTSTVPPSTSPPTTSPPTTSPPTTSPPTTSPPSTAPPSTVPDPDPDPDPDGKRLTAMEPVRLLDTRFDATIDRLGAGDTVRVQVAGEDGVHPDAEAAVLNVVAVRPADVGYLSVTPCPDGDATSASAAVTSTVNFSPGLNTANSTISPLSTHPATSGEVCVYSSVATDVIVDVSGSLGDLGDLGLTNTTGRRIVDSRVGVGRSGRLGAGETMRVDFDGQVSPATSAVAFNLTAVRPADGGFLAVHSCDGTTPVAPTGATPANLAGFTTSALNFGAGETRANNAVHGLDTGTGGQSLCITSSTATDVLVDLTGEFGPGGLEFVPAEPSRLLDTREDVAVAAGSSIGYDVPTLPIASGSGTATPGAASVIITAVRHRTSGFITSWNCGPRPETSTVNAAAGQNTANGALAELNPVGRSCLFHDVGGDLIVDFFGWWM